MNFSIGDRFSVRELRLALGTLCDAVEREMNEISDVRVSFAGWRGTSRLEIRGLDNRISSMNFQRVEGDDLGSQEPRWVRLPGADIVEVPHGTAPARGLDALLRGE